MTIPIALAFDNNLVLPACICLSSLLMHAKDDTYYDIFILHSDKEDLRKTELEKIPLYYKNCNIQFRTVGDVFDQAYEIRGITTPAYYRLLIPEIIPEYDKVIYADADIIFRMDLASVFSIDLGENYIAATRDLGLNFDKGGMDYIQSVEGLHLGDYIQSGFLVLNSRVIRQMRLVSVFKELAKQKLKFQDQDILNIACYGSIHYLPYEYNLTDYSHYYLLKEGRRLGITDEEAEKILRVGNLHFNGHKPWKKYSINYDIWWEYYRKSPYYDLNFYFDYYNSKLNELDSLSFIKRVKLLLRYFIVRK